MATENILIIESDIATQMFSGDIWVTLQQHGYNFPNYVKNIMTITGFDNLQSIGEIDDDDIEEMESFGRLSLGEIIPKNANLIDYLFYQKDFLNFKIMPGHKKAIKKLKNEIQEKGVDYFLKPAKRLMPQILDVNRAKTRKIYDGSDDKKMIENIISSWLKKKNDKTDDVVRLIEIITDADGGAVEAKIFCNLCNYMGKITPTKYKYGRRWVPTNFEKHLNEHFKEKKDTNQKNNNDLRSMFKQIATNTGAPITSDQSSTSSIATINLCNDSNIHSEDSGEC